MGLKKAEKRCVLGAHEAHEEKTKSQEDKDSKVERKGQLKMKKRREGDKAQLGLLGKIEGQKRNTEMGKGDRDKFLSNQFVLLIVAAGKGV